MSQRRINRRAMGGIAAGAAGVAISILPNGAALGQGVQAPLPQATAVSPQGTPGSGQPVPPKRDLRFYDTAPQFQAYYGQVDGLRVLGHAISPLASSGGRAAQYFEKARLEDFRDAFPNTPAYQFQYGLLVDEMKAVRSLAPVGGDASTVTYATIQDASAESARRQPPAGFGGNVAVQPDGSVFIPFSADLSPAAGHFVPGNLWDYINRSDLFPGGWLHDVGLPITEPLSALVDKGIIVGDQITRVTNRPITIQAFQRTILTFDPANPEGYLVERANTGTDFWSIFPDRVPQ
jgi:hypothetical protein